MARPLLLRSAAELLHGILTEPFPADSQMDRFFRAHPQMGVRDRGQVAETVYGALRERRVLEHCCGSVEAGELIATWALLHGISARALEDSGYRGDARRLVEHVRSLDPSQFPFAVRTNLPDWLVDKLVAQFGEAETLALAVALNQPAPVDIRANSLRGDRDHLRTRLADDGFQTEPTPYSPVGLRRNERGSMFSTKSFKEGLFEVQDEGSQLISFLVEPRRQEMVADFCAGAGGKALHLGALMNNSGTVYAFDVSTKRLERLKPRLKRSGLDNLRSVAIAHERDDRVQRLKGKLDRVLVDAPCSGTGTLRRNPDIKWRELDLNALIAEQKKILLAASTLVKPGGRLVYATCSLLREENDDVIADFLAQQTDFSVVSAAEILARKHINLPNAGEALRLLPHQHGTDGFYAIALERKT